MYLAYVRNELSVREVATCCGSTLRECRSFVYETMPTLLASHRDRYGEGMITIDIEEEKTGEIIDVIEIRQSRKYKKDKAF